MSEVKRIASWQVVRNGAGRKGLELRVYAGDTLISGGWMILWEGSTDELRFAYESLIRSCEYALKPNNGGISE